MKTVVGQALHVEIDYYALITFGAVTRLIDAIGGVDVTLNKAVVDPALLVEPDEARCPFPAGVNHLNGQRALMFARTRKGDNDFERARRQQQLIIATVDAVRAKGVAILPGPAAVRPERRLRQDGPAADARAADLPPHRKGA